MKNFSKILLSSVIALSPVYAANAQSDINIWNWSDYIGENTVSDFAIKQCIIAATSLANTAIDLIENDTVRKALKKALDFFV